MLPGPPARAQRRAVAALALLGVLMALFTAVDLRQPARAHALDSGFVTRSGSQLELDGTRFRFSGANMYWLGLLESPSVHFPSDFEVDDAMATAQEMGATVVRSHTLGDTVGCALCLEPSLGTFNPSAFQRIDYAIKSAADHGVRLVIPLVDHGTYYEGGISTYTTWRGITDASRFYTDPTVINDFEQHINALLNHVNTYTGIALKNDPTILAWEDGNELGDPPSSWVTTITAYIKSIDPHHLVSHSAKPGLQTDTLTIPGVDIEDVHYYPMSVSALATDASTTLGAGKVFYAGEYDWINRLGGDSLNSFLSAIENDGAAGDTFWSLFPHADTYGYLQHNDGYTLHYPGDTTDMSSRAQLLRTHAYTMRGLSTPPDGIPYTPLITSVNGQYIAWRGGALAVSYSVERSTSGPSGPWTRVCNGCATDNDTPWPDTGQPPSTTLWYRVKGYNRAGASSNWSPTYIYQPTTTTTPAPHENTATARALPAGRKTVSSTGCHLMTEPSHDPLHRDPVGARDDAGLALGGCDDD